MLGKDDLRFQVNVGEPGRYVGPALTADIVTDADGDVVVEETTAFATRKKPRVLPLAHKSSFTIALVVVPAATLLVF